MRISILILNRNIIHLQTVVSSHNTTREECPRLKSIFEHVGQSNRQMTESELPSENHLRSMIE